MDIVINLESPVAAFTQLINQIKSAVKTETLRPGDPLPSIRQLANDLSLNNKTVAKAYRLLERDAVIQTRGYRGTFVHPDAKANSAVDLHAWVRTTLEQAVDEFRSAGVTDSEIRSALTDVMNRRAPRGDSHV